MVSRDELKTIVILSYLQDYMLDKLVPVVDILQFHQGELIFRQGDPSDRFFMLKRGKVLLEQNLSEEITVSVGSIKPGYSFGWSSMMEGNPYTSDAICSEFCEILSVKGRKFQGLLDSDPYMGYLFFQRLVRVVKSRLDRRTEQFLRVIKHHPDIQVFC